MYKSVSHITPAALCLLCMAGLSACTNESDVAATATATGSVGETSRQASTEREVARSADSETTDREARARERAEAASTARTERERAALEERRSAREARAELARERGSVREVSAREDRERAMVHREPVIAAEPAVLDLGSMPAGETRSGQVRLTNTSDTVITLLNSRTSCGCTVANVPNNHGMAPGESVEVDVSLRTNANRAERLTKTVTFTFEDHPNVVVRVSGESITYVTLSPHVLDPDSNPDGRVLLTSSDGEPFRILGVTPLLAADLPDEPATEHEIVLSWDQWYELRQPRQFEVAVDHPMAQSVRGMIRVPRGAAQAAREQARQEAQQPRVQRETPVQTLAQQGNVDELMKRIAEGADIETRDQQGNTLLSIAAKNGNIELMRALIEAGADVDSFSVRNGVTPLMNASQSRNAETVEVLLEAGADVNARDTVMGATALSWAAMAGDPRMVQALLDAGAEVEVVAQATGWTPLTSAAFGDTRVLKMLIEAGAKTEVHCSIQGATPLMYAVGTGRVANVEALLEAGAGVEAKDASGHTVLLFGARAAGATAETIRLLLEAGADVHATDARGLTALDHARARDDAHRDEVVALLEPHFKKTEAAD